MQAAYIQLIVMLHGAFALAFYFLDRQSPSRFARLFAISWAIEAVRAAIQLPGVTQIWGAQEEWFAATDVLCFAANWCLLAGWADLAEVRLPRWLAPAYFWSGIPIVLFNRYEFGGWWSTLTGATVAAGRSHGILANLVIMFVPVAVARLAIFSWLWRLWRETRLPGALIAAIFCVPYAVVALAVPFQFYYDYNPDWIFLVWSARVLGFSIGLVMLMLDLQQAKGTKNEAGLAAAQSLAKLGSWELNLASGVTVWSAEMFRLYDWDPANGAMSREEFIRRMHPDDREEFGRVEQRALERRESADHEFRFVRPDGTVRWIHGRKTPSFSPAGKLLRMVGVEQDITARKRAESRVALQHAVTRALAEVEPLAQSMAKILQVMAHGLGADFAAFWTLDQVAGTLRCSQLWHGPKDRLAEFAKASRRCAFTAGAGLPGRLWETREAAFAGEAEWERSGETARGEAAVRAGLKGGCGFPIVLHGEFHGVVEFHAVEAQRPDPDVLKLFGDLAAQIGQFIERQRFAEQYRQAQKLEAVGTLAGGIAHDFNNILTAISGYCELAQADTADRPVTQLHLRAVQRAARRAVDLVRQIKTFSQQQEQARVPLALAPIVQEALQLLRATIPATVEIDFSEEAPLPLVLADATSIHQIVVNLGTNASHAMRGRPGRIEVHLQAAVVDTRFVVRHQGLQPGTYVRMTFRDTGEGMDAATLARIYEPFFTTKAPGDGTGLGLAVVHGIVQSHNGSIFVASEPGVGTEFQLYFPVCVGAAEPAAAAAAPTVTRGQGERIMFVDDEAMLIDMGRLMLTRLGYVVEAFENPREALAALKARAGEFQLLITDLTMREMTGLELAEEARRLLPELPVILTSGNTAALKPEQIRDSGVDEFLMKPYAAHEFSATIRKLLVRSGGAAATKMPREGAGAG